MTTRLRSRRLTDRGTSIRCSPSSAAVATQASWTWRHGGTYVRLHNPPDPQIGPPSSRGGAGRGDRCGRQTAGDRRHSDRQQQRGARRCALAGRCALRTKRGPGPARAPGPAAQISRERTRGGGFPSCLGRIDDRSDVSSTRALTWYDSYLSEAPDGPYVSEAFSARKMMVLERAGRQVEATPGSRGITCHSGFLAERTRRRHRPSSCHSPPPSMTGSASGPRSCAAFAGLLLASLAGSQRRESSVQSRDRARTWDHQRQRASMPHPHPRGAAGRRLRGEGRRSRGEDRPPLDRRSDPASAGLGGDDRLAGGSVARALRALDPRSDGRTTRGSPDPGALGRRGPPSRDPRHPDHRTLGARARFSARSNRTGFCPPPAPVCPVPEARRPR